MNFTKLGKITGTAKENGAFSRKIKKDRCFLHSLMKKCQICSYYVV